MSPALKTRIRQLRDAENSRRRALESYRRKKQRDPAFSQKGSYAKFTQEQKNRYNERRRAKKARQLEYENSWEANFVWEMRIAGCAVVGRKGLTAPLFTIRHADGTVTTESLEDPLPTW